MSYTVLNVQHITFNPFLHGRNTESRSAVRNCIHNYVMDTPIKVQYFDDEGQLARVAGAVRGAVMPPAAGTWRSDSGVLPCS